MPLVLALPPVKMHTVIIEAVKSGEKHKIKNICAMTKMLSKI